MTWCVIDLEVENHEYFGSLASPHCPDNYIVAAGWAIDNDPVQSEYYNSPQEAASSDWLSRALEGQKILVAHNATFELHWLLHNYRDTLLNFLKGGGRVYDTQYVEFLLSHQQDMYPKLEDCSVKYGGTKKVDAVKILWEQGFKTSEIDQALLMEYLADPECGDVANTRRVCFSQYKLLKEQGMLPMMWERMDSLLFNAIATYNGLYVDTEVAAKNQAEQEQRILELRESILKSLPSDLPDDLEFSFTSPYHMSAFLYGGTIKYRAKVSYEPKKYEQVEAYEYTYQPSGEVCYIVIDGHDPSDLDIDLVQTIYKSGKNKGLPKVFKIDSTVEKLRWGDKEFKFKGLIDLNSLPQVAREQFLGKRAEFRGARALVDGTPVYSAGKDALDVLAAHKVHEAVLLKELAELEKDVGSFYLRESATGKKSGMLQYVEPTGIVHHQLNNCATVTGRLSSSSPNLHQLPRGGTSKVKEMFVSRFGTQGRMTENDFGALEVVALAAISKDMNLLNQLISGTDMHCYRLAAQLGEPYDEVLKKCKDKSHPEHTEYDEMRTAIKPKSFANQYGASAYGIAFATGCTVEEAELFKQTELDLFPESSSFSSRVIRPEVESTGMQSPIERELNERGEWKIYRRGYFTAKGGTRYSFRQYPKFIDGREYYDYKDTQVANYVIQGESSFIVQTACGRVIRHLIANDFYNGQVLPVNTVHDCIVTDCANPEIAVEAAKAIQDIMSTTPKYLCEKIPAYKDWNYHTTPFTASSEFGQNMMHMEHVH